MIIQYLKQHWQGDRTQGTAYWVNVVSLLLLLKFAIAMLSIISVIENPVLSTRIWLLISLVVLLVVLPWSFIGSVRSTWQHIHLFQDRTTGIWLLVALIITFGYCTMQFKDYLPGLNNMVNIAFKKESESYSVIGYDNQLSLSGYLTYGSAKTITSMLKSNKAIDTIELNLSGGHLYEARQLSEYLAKQPYHTHVEEQCALNCLIVFMGGTKRTAADSASFSFHHQRGYENGYRSDWTITREQVKDREYFEKRGVYKKSTFALYYKQAKDTDLTLTNEMLKSYNILTQ
ncbi:hypothetical protein [Reinekea sp.]|uniref:hypothetical protein n=1 Tax=Reinekea sp. TaxID=1970455 RepID=UPI003988AF9E